MASVCYCVEKKKNMNESTNNIYFFATPYVNFLYTFQIFLNYENNLIKTTQRKKYVNFDTKLCLNVSICFINQYIFNKTIFCTAFADVKKKNQVRLIFVCRIK